MKEVCGPDKAAKNYAWSFDGVPEENSLLLDYGNAVVELPAMDLVLYKPLELLGPQVYSRFGAEFPIRFDFLDTIGGQNLSLQVHPVTEYMHRQFGMAYHELEFIETRRYWITDEVVIQPEHNVNMLNLVEGAAAVIDSPEGEFAPFMVHYAETFIIPAGVKKYRIRPEKQERIAVLRAYVRVC